MFTQKIKNISLSNFGPFVGSHNINLPTNGLLLIKGSSGSGKSYLLNSIPYVLGGCPFASTELQSWFTDEIPEVKLILETQKGLIEAIRKKGLSLRSEQLKEVYKGKAADPELDSLFGMDAKVRAQVTYRGQRKPGLFLSMSDPDKKSFLTKLLDLNKYERVEKAAKDAVDLLEDDLKIKQSSVETYRKLHEIAESNFNILSYDIFVLEDLLNKKQLVEQDLDKNKQLQLTATSAIDSIKKKHQEELEASYKFFEGKVAEVYNRIEPAEIASIKSDIKKQQERLEKCRKYDSEKLLEVAKQRATITAELSDGVNKYNNLVAVYNNNCRVEFDGRKYTLSQELNESTAQLKKKEFELKEISRKLDLAKLELNGLKKEEAELRLQLCPTCKQTWKESSKKLEENLKNQQEILQLIAVNNNNDSLLSQVLTDINNLQIEYKTVIDKLVSDLNAATAIKTSEVENQKAVFIKEKQQELNSFKDPEPHPAGAQVLKKIEELEAAIKIVEKSFKSQKDLDAKALKDERDRVKAQKDISLAKELEERQLLLEEYKKAEKEFKDQFVKINDMIAKQQQLEALFKERQEVLKKAAVDLEQVRATFAQTEAKLSLESDLVALIGYKGFLGAIFGDILAEISSQTNDILGQVANVRHLTIDFETEKEAVTTGNVTSRITPVIYNRGRKVSFEAGISGGQQTSVELAVDLAVSNVVSNRRGVYPNFLILDESLHGLGGVDKESCIEMLQSVAGERLVLVVDHSPEFCNLFSQVIEVVQEDGQSRIL